MGDRRRKRKKILASKLRAGEADVEIGEDDFRPSFAGMRGKWPAPEIPVVKLEEGEMSPGFDIMKGQPRNKRKGDRKAGRQEPPRRIRSRQVYADLGLPS